ncbi:MAG: helix-turn-helix transcriptional regulator [Armatimonadetes bacterium]|nr:helix-turn-helix transcriptional regulator [Armatimonadota bacterium]
MKIIAERPAEGACCPECGCQSHTDSLDRAAVDAGAALLAALGDPVRLGIVELLARHDRMCVCDIAEAFPVGQPTISHHLRLLREAGLADVVRRGNWAFYGLRREVLKQVAHQILNLL